MNTRRRRNSGTVPLPWEGRHAWLAQLFSLRRVRPLLIAALVVTLLVAAYDMAVQRSRVRESRAAIAEVRRAIAAFRAELDRCPRSTVELVHPPKAGAQYLDELPRDGWGRELLVRCPGTINSQSADVVSAGESGSFAIDDNIM